MNKQLFTLIVSTLFFSFNFFPVHISDIGIHKIIYKGEDYIVDDLAFGGDSRQAYFGIFDGHGGKFVAETACKYLEVVFQYYLSQGLSAPDALKKSIEEFDKGLIESEQEQTSNSGSTALICYFTDNRLHLANLGDSRVVSCKNSSSNASQLTHDHKPDDPQEKERIEAAGGAVFERGGVARVDGLLAVPRSLGDRWFKSPSDGRHHVTNIPEINSYEISSDDAFLIFASDGCWDACNNENAVRTVRASLSLGDSALHAAQKLGKEVIKQRKLQKMNKEDITIMIITFDACGKESPLCKRPRKLSLDYSSEEEYPF